MTNETRDRIYGEDKPFCDWMRRHKLLPSKGDDECGFAATDVDVHIHRFITSVDSLGTRQIQSMMTLEVKTRNGKVHFSQLDTLAKQHMCSQGQQFFLGQLVWHWGVSIVRLSGETPEDSSLIRWGRFVTPKQVQETDITADQLIDLMRFELHPDTLLPRPFRRHHKTHKFYVQEKAPLGFTYDKPIVKRS